jgi:hypothetical protein
MRSFTSDRRRAGLAGLQAVSLGGGDAEGGAGVDHFVQAAKFFWSSEPSKSKLSRPTFIS